MKNKKYFLFLSVLLIFISSITANFVMGQSKRDCRRILKTKIEYDTTGSSVLSIFENFKLITICNCDSTDYKIFFENTIDSGFAYQLLGMLIINATQESNDPGIITYNDLLSALQKFIESNSYFQYRQYTLAFDKLSCKYPNLETWSEDSSLLIQMGSSPEQIKELKSIIIENDYSSWTTLLQDYRDSKIKKEPETENKSFIPDSGKIEILKGLYAFESYESGIQKSKISGKPVLLYFSGYGTVNCREIEATVLLSSSIKEVINSGFEFIMLIVDDNTALPPDKVYYSDALNKNIMTVGNLNYEMEMKDYGAETQPFFVIIDSFGNVISTQGYTRDKSEFLNFLNRAIK